MIKRNLAKNILKSMEIFPVLSILGSRQVGKTTLAKEIKKIIEKNNIETVYLDLELPSDYNILSNIELFFENNQNKTIIIDEVQVRPDIYPVLRGIIDKNRKNGAFILLGSSSPGLQKNSSESLAGRITEHVLNPFDITEVGFDKSNLNKLWLYGGYPESFLAQNDENSYLWRISFLKTFFERDIPQLGINIPAQKLKHFWQLICHYHGQVWNASQISRNIGLSATTVRNYMFILEETFLVRRLEPYFVNIKKRIIRAPKYYVIDSGLFHASHNIIEFNTLLGFAMSGASWEGFVIEQIIRNLDYSFEFFYYRTQTGNEIDLILKKGNNIYAVEIKMSMSPAISKGLRIGMEDIKAESAYIIYPGEKSYYLDKNIMVSSLNEFLSRFIG